ncbi:MAG TPA: potassium transporter TrkG, partial [bacterium]
MANQRNKPASLKPVQVLAGSFLGLIILGTVVLLLPECHAPGSHITFLDSLFTATSAVCVTGLITVDTSSQWTRLGQVAIMIMFQLGGIGIITFGAFFALLLGQKINFRQRELLKEQFGEDSVANILKIIPVVAGTTIIIEMIGAAILYPFIAANHPASDALFHSVFHAVSAFCNAGFSTYSDSLMGYSSNIGLNATICILIVLGGLGFPVITELLNFRERRRRLSLHTRMVLWASGFLIVAGTALIFTFEYNGSAGFRSLPFNEMLLGSLFQSITTRTAGFNTLDIGSMAPASIILMGVLMFIGGSPSGTAGGIKTTTVLTSIASIRAVLRGEMDVIIFDRRIKWDTVRRANGLVVLSAGTFIGMVLLMYLTGGGRMLDLWFETLSALGTVGLSTGIT